MGESEERYRLPRTVVPSRYDLTLEPDLDAGTFDGTIEVALQILEPVTEIVLNANELKLESATLTAADGRAVEVAKILTDDDAERATLPLAETAEPGDWTLRITFAGELNPRLTGFYRSTYQDADGATRVVGTTHFEATDARRAFPCWDEPDLKAVFATTLVVKEGLTAVSNGAGGGTGDARRRAGADPVRRHDEDVDLPGGVGGRAARDHGARRRTRRAGADRPRPRQGTPHAVRARRRPSTR